MEPVEEAFVSARGRPVGVGWGGSSGELSGTMCETLAVRGGRDESEREGDGGAVVSEGWGRREETASGEDEAVEGVVVRGMRWCWAWEPRAMRAMMGFVMMPRRNWGARRMRKQGGGGKLADATECKEREGVERRSARESNSRRR